MIECKNVSVVYNNEVEALHHIDLAIKGPTITGIIGPNGSGKSTLLKAILGMAQFNGEINIDGVTSKKFLKKNCLCCTKKFDRFIVPNYC
ncbi:manganese ABC transporter [Liquorilactobacillus sucicola DSM 21376 = JCM 15457]|nr:manganese ABC transporter [Liquorilactobacillus sucicola DSM 21376 = JCM 15457]